LNTQYSNKNKFLGFIFALGATAIWSGNFIIARDLSENVPPISLAFWRWTVAILVFIPFALKHLIADWKLLKKHMPYLIIVSFLGVTVFNTLVYIAGHTTTAINLSLIAITFPIFIIIFSRIFLHEAITFVKIIGIVLVTFGVVFIITKGSLSSLFELSFFKGDLWMLLASVIFAVYSIFLQQKPAEIHMYTLQLTTFILGLLMLFPFYIWEYQTTPVLTLEFKSISAIIYLGVFASLAAYLLWNKAVVTIGSTKAGMVYYTLPLFSGVLAYFILDENLSIVHLYSAILIIAGILISNYKVSKT